MRVISMCGGMAVEATALSIKGNDDVMWEIMAHIPMEMTWWEGKFCRYEHSGMQVPMAIYTDIAQARAELGNAAMSSAAYQFGEDEHLFDE